MCLRLVFLHGFPAKWTQSANNSYLSDAERYSQKPGKTTQLQKKERVWIGLEKIRPFLSSVCNFHAQVGATGKTFMLALSAAHPRFLGILYSALFPPQSSLIAVAII